MDQSYKNHRYPIEIVAPAVWLNFRFPLSLRAVKECFWSSHR
jgi:putative transposase